MITNRNIQATGFGDEFSGLSFWTNQSGPVDDFRSWTRVEKVVFQLQLFSATRVFPDPIITPSEAQKHVTCFVHGYNEAWGAACRRYGLIADNLFLGAKSLGECVLFSWPSEGSAAGYLPDRAQARKSGEDFADVLGDLYDSMLENQHAATEDPSKTCRAKTSVIAHSMGNYLLENAMNIAWTRKNRALLVSLINQLLMIAADVDNDIFKSGEAVTNGDGEGIANLTYRVTALYSGRDSVLGMSAGLKHFGKRRLGRSGLDTTYPLPDNVWGVDCSKLLPKKIDGMHVHSAYFEESKCYDLMRAVLLGTDRSVLIGRGLVPPAMARQQAVGI